MLWRVQIYFMQVLCRPMNTAFRYSLWLVKVKIMNNGDEKSLAAGNKIYTYVNIVGLLTSCDYNFVLSSYLANNNFCSYLYPNIWFIRLFF